MGIASVDPHQDITRDATTTENAKPASSSSMTTRKENEALSPDLCSSKSVLERAKERDPPYQQDDKASETAKAEERSSAATKEVDIGGVNISELRSAGASTEKARGSDRNEEDVWLHCVNNHHN